MHREVARRRSRWQSTSPRPHSMAMLRRPARGRHAALLLAAASAVVLTACEQAPRAPAPSNAPVAPAALAVAQPPSPPHLVVLGIDAGTWDLLDPWMDQGLLPNLARIRAGGVHGKLHSTEPSSSPVIWTSIATGKVPAKTGIDWFVRFPDGPGKPVPVDRRQRKVKALWNMLSQHRLDVAVLGWYVTWPAEEVNGRLLTDLAHFGPMPSGAFPEQLLWDLPPVPEKDAVAAMKGFMDFQYDPARAVKTQGEAPSLDYLVFDRFVRAWARDKYYLEAADRVLKDGPLPDAFFLYLRGTDDVQHGFWKFMDPAPFTPRTTSDGKPVAGTVEISAEQGKAFGRVIQRYWQWIDEGVGRLLKHYEKNPPLVLVCSDHGAGPAVGEHAVEVPEYLHLSGSHRIDGMFMASGPGIRHGSDPKGIEIEGAGIYDIAPTALFAMGLPVGRDMDGHVLTAVFDEAVASRPDARVDTWESEGEQKAPEAQVPAQVDEKVLEQLRSLGYIGQ